MCTSHTSIRTAKATRILRSNDILEAQTRVIVAEYGPVDLIRADNPAGITIESDGLAFDDS
jgi:hypothetical protein